MYKKFIYSLIIFFVLVISHSVFAQDEEPFEMTMEDWQRMQDEYTAKKDHLTIQLNNLNTEIDGLKKSNADRDAALTKALNNLYEAVGSTKSGVVDYRKDFEETEKIINSKSGNVAEARKKFEILKASKVRCLPEFWDRFNAMEKKINNWEPHVDSIDVTIKVKIPQNVKRFKITVDLTSSEESSSEKPSVNSDNIIKDIKGLIAYYIPDIIEFGKEAEVIVIISKKTSKDSISLEGFENKEMFNFSNVINLPDRIKIKLYASNKLVTTLLGEEEREINADKIVWRWTLAPPSEGEYRLSLESLNFNDTTGNDYQFSPYKVVKVELSFWGTILKIIPIEWNFDTLKWIFGILCGSSLIIKRSRKWLFKKIKMIIVKIKKIVSR